MAPTKSRLKKAGEISNLEKLFRVKKNQILMMERRGYPIDAEDKEIIDMKQNEFLDWINRKAEDMTINDAIHALNKLYVKIKPDGMAEKNYVYYMSPNKDGKKICSKQIQVFVEFMKALSDVRLVDIISDREFHTLSRASIDDDTSKKYKIWLYNDLSYNVFESAYVPKYKKFPENKTKEVFYEVDGVPLVKRSNLPYLCIDDPIAKLMNLESGDIVESISTTFFIPSLVPDMIQYKQVVPRSINSSNYNKNEEI